MLLLSSEMRLKIRKIEPAHIFIMIDEAFKLFILMFQSSPLVPSRLAHMSDFLKFNDDEISSNQQSLNDAK